MAPSDKKNEATNVKNTLDKGRRFYLPKRRVIKNSNPIQPSSDKKNEATNMKNKT